MERKEMLRKEMSQTFLPYKILKQGGCGEIVEKKSRFIATLSPAASEEEAAAFIESVKKILGCQAQLFRVRDRGAG